LRGRDAIFRCAYAAPICLTQMSLLPCCPPVTTRSFLFAEYRYVSRAYAPACEWRPISGPHVRAPTQPRTLPRDDIWIAKPSRRICPRMPPVLAEWILGNGPLQGFRRWNSAGRPPPEKFEDVKPYPILLNSVRSCYPGMNGMGQPQRPSISSCVSGTRANFCPEINRRIGDLRRRDCTIPTIASGLPMIFAPRRPPPGPRDSSRPARPRQAHARGHRVLSTPIDVMTAELAHWSNCSSPVPTSSYWSTGDRCDRAHQFFSPVLYIK